MRKQPRNHPKSGRVALAIFLQVGLGILIVISVRSIPTWGVGIILAVVGGMFLTVLFASPAEWLVHRYIYHRPSPTFLKRIYRIHQSHHYTIFPIWRYTTNGPVRRHPVLESDVKHVRPAGWKNIFTKLAHFSFYMSIGFGLLWTPAWIATKDAVFLGSIILTSAVVSDLFVRVHDAIHYPDEHKFMQRRIWFKFLDGHHYIHHIDTEANVNFLLPLMDWLAVTLRRRMTREELAKHGSLQEARSNPRGNSEPVHSVTRP